jgi:hypothetical protein
VSYRKQHTAYARDAIVLHAWEPSGFLSRGKREARAFPYKSPLTLFSLRAMDRIFRKEDEKSKNCPCA